MKNNVYVPLISRLGIPCASLPTSLPAEMNQSFFYLGLLIRCLYCSNSPVSPSNTALEYSHKNSRGYFLDALLRAVKLAPVLEISIACNATSCVSVLDRVFERVLKAGPSCFVSSCHLHLALVLSIDALTLSVSSTVEFLFGFSCVISLSILRVRSCSIL